MKIYVDCIGCEQRQLDAQHVIDYVRSEGAEISASPKNCDFAVLVTCAVDKASEMRSAKRLGEIAEDIPNGAKIVVGGCMPSISPERLTQHNVSNTFSPRDMNRLQQIFGFEHTVESVSYPNKSGFDQLIVDNSEPLSAREEYEAAKSGFKIRIDNGCLLKCSYCVIRLATGKLESIDPDLIKRQFGRAIAIGEKSVMLVGGDTGAYGFDTDTKLYNLLGEILSIPGDVKLYIHDFNINWLIRDIDKYLEVFSSEEGQRIGAISFPIQSGSDRILKLMRRPYVSKDVISTLNEVRRTSPHIKIGTHIIVGFPGESEDDFLKTQDLLDKMPFDFATCFAYSENDNADSSKYPQKVDNKIIDYRLDTLSERYKDKMHVIR